MRLKFVLFLFSIKLSAWKFPAQNREGHFQKINSNKTSSKSLIIPLFARTYFFTVHKRNRINLGITRQGQWPHFSSGKEGDSMHHNRKVWRPLLYSVQWIIVGQQQTDKQPNKSNNNSQLVIGIRTSSKSPPSQLFDDPPLPLLRELNSWTSKRGTQ